MNDAPHAMSPFIRSPAPDPRLYALLADAGFGDDVFNPRQHRSCELLGAYTLAHVVELVDRLGLAAPLARPSTVDALLAACGLVRGFRVPLRWLLERLALAGIVERDASGRYRLAGPPPRADLAALRAEVLDADPSYAPAVALVEGAAGLYPAVARGETDGEAALFRKAALWFAYFSNANGYYALNNRVAARVAARRLPGAGARVVEVGAGLGSATEALLGRLRADGTRVASYRVTEPVALFRRRAERTLAATEPGVPFTFAGLDLNEPWAAQGVAPGSADLVWGVNVFHLARRLDAVLGEALAALAPGGALVVGEGLRPCPAGPVDAEFPFQLLESFTAVEVDPATRAVHGFLTAEEWLGALRRAGFAAVEVVPDPIRLRPFYAGFLAGAVCGRRPGASAA
jgi:SAM-dependent methyltransferase